MHLPAADIDLAALVVLVANGILTLSLALGLRPRREPSSGSVSPAPRPRSLTCIRPLRGVDDDAAASNRSLAAQRWEGAYELVFVASDPDDAGLALARECHGSDPRMRFLSAPSRADATDKAGNMMRAWRATRSELVAFCDADITLAPDTVVDAARAFDDPAVVAVFAPVLYRPASLPQRLSAVLTVADKLIVVRTLDRWRRLDLMEGGLMIVRRAAVDALGPIEEVLGNTIADDLRLATALASAGGVLRAAAPIVHPQRPASVAAWARQYHRWMVCQRAEHPRLLIVQLMLNPIMVPLFVLLLHPFAPATALTILGISVAWRIALSALTDHFVLRPYGVKLGWWALARPLADLAHFAVCVSAFVDRSVTWGGRTYRFPTRRVATRALTAKAPGSST